MFSLSLFLAKSKRWLDTEEEAAYCIIESFMLVSYRGDLKNVRTEETRERGASMRVGHDGALGSFIV